jgi:hypothetical protein
VDQEHNTNLMIDSAVAGGVMTMPMWAVGLNEWAVLFLHLGGAILVSYRLWVMIREIKNKE